MQSLPKFLKHPFCVVYTTPQICTITRNLFPRPRPTNVEVASSDDDVDGGPCSVRLLLQSKPAKIIAGKGDENLRRLESNFTGTQVSIPKLYQNSSQVDLGRRILTISAEQKDQCVAVLKECLPFVKLPPYPVGKDASHAFEIDLLVPSSGCGSIIGAKGKRIRKLRTNTNTQINIYQDCLPASNERVLALGGSGTDDIVAAVKKILYSLEVAPVKDEDNTILYDPSCDDSLEPVEKRNRRHRGKEKSTEDVTRPKIDKQQPTHDGTLRTTDGGRQMKEMSVRVNLVGSILGKGGEILQHMRQESGASINISGAEEHGKRRMVNNSKYRLITIVGSEDQVTHAEQLIKSFLQEHLES